jgi:glutaredoxin
MKTKKFFKENEVPFDHVDFDLASKEEQEKIIKEMRGYGVAIAFPFVKIDGEVVAGYNPDRYKELLSL